MQTIKVKPWGEGQGDFVLINEADFVEGVHQRLDAPAPAAEAPAEPAAASPAPARKRAAPAPN